MPVPDLSLSPLLASGVSIGDGSLPSGLPLDEAFALAESTLKGGARAGGAFRLSLDDAGRALVEVSDRASLARLRSVVAQCPSRREARGVQVIAEESAAQWRAVLECFYGELWTPAERIHVLEAGASQGANAYVYGPSADRRTGGAWREPYPDEQRRVLADFTARARELGVRTIWRVSPAAPLEPENALRFSDVDDVLKLREVATAAIEMGFDAVLIAFDDIKASLDEASALAYAESPFALASAHAHAINAVVADLGAERVIACPTHYWSGPGSSYRRVFGAELAQGVPVCWTGPDVISEQISGEMAADVADELGHPVWLWDNYPVNDWDVLPAAASRTRLHDELDNLISPRRMPLAPLRGRDGALPSVVAAYGANAALFARTGVPAIRTALDFAWSGPGYDPDVSWSAAVRRLDVDPDALDVVADACGPLAASARTSPPLLARACAAVLLEEDRPAALAHLRRVLDSHLAAIAQVRATAAPEVLVELRPWLHSLSNQCVLVELAHRALSSTPHQSGRISRLLDVALARVDQIPTVIGAGRMLAEYARGITAGGTPAIPD